MRIPPYRLHRNNPVRENVTARIGRQGRQGEGASDGPRATGA